MPLYTTDALILRTYTLGESDRIVVLHHGAVAGRLNSFAGLGQFGSEHRPI